MLKTFEWFYRQLGRATMGVFMAALGFLAFALLCALAGLVNAVPWFREAALVLGGVFLALFALLLVTAVVAALIRYLHRQSRPSI